MTANDAASVASLLRTALGDPVTAWSLGSFGAVAEFMRDPDEAVARLNDGRFGLSTERGAIALQVEAGLRPVAYETAFRAGWSHAIALCLPEATCGMNRRSVVTELGPDAEAARPLDRDGILFDLGLGLRAVDACVRSHDPETTACLRAGCGLPLFDPLNPIGRRLVSLSPHRVFLARIGRIEVFQPIPPPDGASPEGPHTHVVPQLLRAGRTHAATAPIPDGFVPVATIHPPHPSRDLLGRHVPFRREIHDAFQRLLARWGDCDLLAVKQGRAEGHDRHGRNARRTGEVQASYLHSESAKV